MLTYLVNLLSSGSLDSTHGSMKVLSEFIKSDLTEDQILPVLRDLLPVLLNILGSSEVSLNLISEYRKLSICKQSPMTRARTISVFRQCVSTLYMVKEQHPQAVKESTDRILPVWIEAFKVLLNEPPLHDVENAQTWDKLAIRIEIFKVCNESIV